MITERIPPEIYAMANRYAVDVAEGDTKAWFDVRDAIAKAIFDEREHCAKIAESGKPLIVEISPECLVDVTDDYGETLGKIKRGKITRQDWRKGISADIRSSLPLCHENDCEQ